MTRSNLLPEDGIVDEVAIGIAVSGQRVVRMTLTERQMAARRIIAGGADVRELAARLGMLSSQVASFAESIGYRVTPPCRKTKHRMIVRAA